MADPTTAAKKATPAKAERLNVLKFNIAGFIAVNSKDTKTIIAASDLFNAALAVLKGGKPEDVIKAVTDAVSNKTKVAAVITKDEEPQYTTVAADTGEE